MNTGIILTMTSANSVMKQIILQEQNHNWNYCEGWMKTKIIIIILTMNWVMATA